jgi:transcriptional regulator with XRE-family HTH domain
MQPETGRLRVVTAPERVEESPAALASDGITTPGRYVREQRQRRGISLEQLAVATKIPRASLEALEEGRHEELPGPVFVKGFLRCAARSMGLDPDAVMELLYQQQRAALQARRRAPAPVPESTAAAAAPRRSTPRATAAPTAGGGGQRVRDMIATLPVATTLLWLVVAAVLAMILMATFNLLGSPPGVPPT